MSDMLIKLFKTQLVYFGFYTSSIFPVLQSAGNIVVTCDGPGPRVWARLHPFHVVIIQIVSRLTLNILSPPSIQSQYPWNI